MINQNDIMVGGNVTKVLRKDDKVMARIWVDLPATDFDSDREDKVVNVPIDVADPKNYSLTEGMKPGDFFAARCQFVNQRLTPDGMDKKYTIRWAQAIPSRRIIFIPDAGKLAPACVNDVTVQGRCTNVGDLLKTAKTNKAMIFTTVSYYPRLDKNASEDEKKAAIVYIDSAFFGGTAENYIAKYLKKDDLLMVTGHLAPYEEKWKFKEKPVRSIRVEAREAKFITPAPKAGGGSNHNNKPTGYDEDLTF